MQVSLSVLINNFMRVSSETEEEELQAVREKVLTGNCRNGGD